MQARIKLGIAAASVAGMGLLGVAAAAGPALAGTPPTGTNLPTTVTVQTPLIALAMTTTALAINAIPGQPSQSAVNAVSYTVSSQDSTGYFVTVAAPDLSDGAGHTLPATALADSWSVAPGNQGGTLNGTSGLANTPVTTYSTTKMSSNGSGGPDTFAEQWAATVPGTQAPGSYSTTISYVANAK